MHEADSQPATALLASGDRTLRGHVQQMLEQGGYRVKTVNDGRAALAAGETVLPDLLLIDARVEQVDGSEVCRRIRANPQTAHLPVLVLTPAGDSAARVRALESGADDVVPLPVDASELLARVHNLLTQKGRRAATVEYERNLTALLTLTAQIHRYLDMHEVLTLLHQAIQEQLGFRTVVILLLDPIRQILEPFTVGTTSALSGALGAAAPSYPWSAVQPFLAPRYQVSRSYFVSRAGGPGRPLPSGSWQRGETLLVPLTLLDGRQLGLLSLDAPDDGSRPTREQIHWIELFADHAAVAIHNAQLYAEQQRRVSAYVSAPVAAQLKARGAPPLQPTELQVAILFSDLREFTPLAERLTPVQLVDQVLNPYFHYMTEVIHNHGGVVDKFLGDGIMAVWGLPAWQGDEAARALLAGLAMESGLRGLQAQWRHTLGWEIGMGVGVAVGSAVVGNVGSPQRMDYTAIGPVVNLASRVASLAPPGEVWTTGEAARLAETYIYTDAQRRALFPLAFRPLMPTMLKGVTDIQALYACFLT